MYRAARLLISLFLLTALGDVITHPLGKYGLASYTLMERKEIHHA